MILDTICSREKVARLTWQHRIFLSISMSAAAGRKLEPMTRFNGLAAKPALFTVGTLYWRWALRAHRSAVTTRK
ncbi:hypothetical protein TNCV_705081 [Trichonephila clavipes]|nr:hypothetical protein TNCV_705081 [Trichonephila clavipes]